MCIEITESNADGPPNKRQHLDDSTTANTSTVWECMAKILKDSEELTDDVGVVGEIEVPNTYHHIWLFVHALSIPYFHLQVCLLSHY